MARIKVFWTETAIRQRDYIFSYWNKNNGNKKYSTKLNFKIKQRINLLARYPLMGVRTSYEETRAVNIGHYSILHKITKDHILIIGVWDNRQDPNKLLNFLRK